MSRERVARAVAFVAIALSGSCTVLFDADEISAEHDREERDAGIDAEASSDAQTTPDEGAFPSEGGDGGARFCASSAAAHDAALCDDFDEGPLGQRWSVSALDAGGTLALSAAAVRSEPNAMVAETASSSSSSARLGPHLVFARDLVNLRITFQMRLEAVDPTASYTLVAYQNEPSAGNGLWRASIVGSGDQLSLRIEVAELVNEYPIAKASTLGQWKKVTLHAKPRGASVTVEVDDEVVVSQAPPQALDARGATVFLGVWVVASTQVVRVRYDDVIISSE